MRQALAAGWVSFVVLAAASSPAHFWLDSGELGAAGASLGVMHPPGTPGLALLLRAGAMLPVGSVGFRLAVVSALLGASAIALVFLLLQRHAVHGMVRWGVVAWMLSGWTLVRQARVVEIYTLAALLLLLVLWGFDPVRRGQARLAGRLIATACAAWGAWCFGDLRLALVPAVALMWGLDVRRQEPWTRWAPLLVAAGCCVLFTLPLASARGPIADWGDPDGVRRMASHLNAESIRDAYRHEMLPASLPLWGRNFADSWQRLSEDLGPLGPALVVVALGGALLAHQRRRDGGRSWIVLVAWVLAVEVFYAVGINPMGGSERQTGLVFALLAGLVVGTQLERWTRRVPTPVRLALLPMIWLVLVLPAQLTSLPDARDTRSWMPHAWARAALAQLPPGGLLLSQTDDLSAGVLAARVLEGARPDVVSAPGQHLYRAPTDWIRGHAAAHRMWTAAASGDSEAARIEAAIAAWDGPVALEDAGARLFRPVRFSSPRGDVPLSVRVPGFPAAETAPRTAAGEAEAWLAHVGGRQDRLRLAVALGNRERARLRTGGDEAIARAAATFELILSDVAEDHPSTLVALGALIDRRGGTELAITLTRRALEGEPDRHAALLKLALYLSRDPSSRAQAVALAERAAALRPWRVDAWERLAQVRHDSGDADGAQRARDEAKLAGRAN